MEKRPIFVKIEEYKDIRNILDLVKGKIGEARHLIEEIEKLRHQEAQELDTWKGEVEDVQNRVDFIQRSMFGE